MEIKMYTHFEISELSLQLSGDFVRRVEVKRNADFLSNLAREGFISPSHSEKENWVSSKLSIEIKSYFLQKKRVGKMTFLH